MWHPQQGGTPAIPGALLGMMHISCNAVAPRAQARDEGRGGKNAAEQDFNAALIKEQGSGLGDGSSSHTSSTL